MINAGMMSSKSDEWTTPFDLFLKLDDVFQFDLDAAATKENALCHNFFDREMDGLLQPWGGRRIFCNPPYSQIKLWAAKFVEESERAACIVALIPARTDTKWFQSIMRSADHVHFIKGRLKFGDGAGSAPFPSALAFWLGLNRL